MRFIQCGVERLERRYCFDADFSNSFNPLDVNDDGNVSAIDALVIINDLNSKRSTELIGSRRPDQFYVDVDGDDRLSPRDALIVVNLLNRGAHNRSVDLPLISNLRFESDPNGNGVVLRPDLVIQGQAAAGVSVRVKVDGQVQAVSIVDAAGNYSLPVTLANGRHNLRIEAADVQSNTNWTEREVSYGDVVQDWNAAMLNVIRDWATLSNDPYENRVVTERPPVAARNLAMIHAAMYDAMNTYEQPYEPFLVDSHATSVTSAMVASSVAANRVASSLYREPRELAVLDATLAESLASVADGPEKQQGMILGGQIADAYIAWRTGDGSISSFTYLPSSEPGRWNRTYPDFLPPLLPQWPDVKPFAITSGFQFRPPSPPSLTSPEYATAVDEVMRLGGYQSDERTKEQTDIALFWADGGGTFTPPGHWNQIAATVALDKRLSPIETARLFAMLNVALVDAGIAAWDAKYAYDLWRPIDAIRRAGNEGNSALTADPNWMPLLKTPPFPTYVSGHSTFSGAAAEVLTRFFGDNVEFTSTSDDHSSFRGRPLASNNVLTRSFTSFREAAAEAGRSRIFGGIHFEFDNQAGLQVGESVGAYVVDHFFRVRG